MKRAVRSDILRASVWLCAKALSTLAKWLAEATGLPLYPLDTIKYRAGGGEVPHQEYLKAHAGLLNRDSGSLTVLVVPHRPGSGSPQPILWFTLTCPF
jgi:hypothetical protein